MVVYWRIGYKGKGFSQQIWICFIIIQTQNDEKLQTQICAVAPEQLRALAFVAEEDLESGRNFISGFLDLRASRA